jgi:hypothetical protein
VLSGFARSPQTALLCNICWCLKWLVGPPIARRNSGNFALQAAEDGEIYENFKERHGKRYNSQCASGLSVIIAPRAVGVAGCKYESSVCTSDLSIALDSICVSASGDSGAHN